MKDLNSTKQKLHSRSYHREAYSYDKLVLTHPPLKACIITNKRGQQTINYSDQNSVKQLNKALILHHYDLDYWDIPEGYLCPAVPGRAEYLHYLADLLASFNNNKIPKGPQFKCLDLGVGANCIYPIIGRKVYKWSFIASEIDKKALNNAKQLISKNTILKDQVQLRPQPKSEQILLNILKPDEYIDLAVCNPPFFESEKAAIEANTRKTKNLSKKSKTDPGNNFRGQAKELWCKGGEVAFISRLITESQKLATSCFLYSSLVSTNAHLEQLQQALDKSKVTFSTTVELQLGNKKSQFIAWSFLNPKQMTVWAKARW